jgi:hypothetical protein
MFVSTRRLLLLCLLFVLIPGLSSAVNAQRNPTMPSQLNDSAKEDLYAEFLANKKIPNAEKQRLAYEAAKEYVRRFAGDKDSNLAEAKRFVLEYERVKGHYELSTAYSVKDYAKTFELGRAMLQSQADDFYVLATLALAGYDSSQSGNNSFNEEAVGYVKKAIGLADSGGLTTADPFASVDAARGFLNFELGWFLRTQSPAEAATALTIAAKVDSQYAKDPLTYNLLGIAILKGEYAQVAAEYNTKFGSKPPSPEQEAMLKKLVKLGDRAIDAYARAVALSSKPEQQDARNKMLTQLTALYKSFHNNSDAGLNDLISTVLTKPLPE